MKYLAAVGLFALYSAGIYAFYSDNVERASAKAKDEPAYTLGKELAMSVKKAEEDFSKEF